MKQKKLSLLILAATIQYAVNAHDFEVNGIYYNLLTGFTCEVSYRGASYSEYENEYSGKVVIPETVEYKGRTLKVTSIGYCAFYDCSKLTGVTIPTSVVGIRSEAFYGCSKLTGVYITDLADWCKMNFDNSSHNNPLSYAKHLYVNNQEVRDLVIPNSVTSIGDNVFSGCDGLTSVTIPNSVTSIESYAFSGCDGLTSVTIPNSVTSIGYGVFSGCDGLTSVTIGNSVTSIKPYVFSGCTSLTSVTIPNSVTSIESYAFKGCSGLRSITIGNSVTDFEDEIFNGCDNLNTMIFADGETTLHWWGYVTYGDYKGYHEPSIPPVKNVYLGRPVVVHAGTLKEHNAYESYPFKSNSSLIKITIGEGFTSIDDTVIAGCENLTLVTIGKNVTAIEGSTFKGCDKLQMLVLETTTPPTVGPGNFDNADYLNLVVKVPYGTLATYQAADVWKNFWELQESPSGIGHVTTDVEGCDAPIYNLHGVRMDENKEDLPAGIYIQGGKKIVVK